MDKELVYNPIQTYIYYRNSPILTSHCKRVLSILTDTKQSLLFQLQGAILFILTDRNGSKLACIQYMQIAILLMGTLS